MKQRFFFDRVASGSADMFVVQTVKRALSIFTDPAKAPLTVGDSAAVTAQSAAYVITIKPVPKYSLFHF